MEIDFYLNAHKIDEILSKGYNTKAEQELHEVINSGREFEDYFFKRLDEVEWFFFLKEKNFFSPNKSPGQKSADQKGYVIIPEWNVLPYLERVSQQIGISGNEKYIDELLSIIKYVSNYKNSSGQHIDNYRTWYYFVKILLNIPNEKIPYEIINLISIWLDSKFDTMLQGADIATKLLPKFLPENPTPEDIQKAEKIIESITEIKIFPLSEERAKLLGDKEAAKLVVDPYWLEKVFEKYSAIIAEKCSNKFIEDLAKKVKSLLKKENEGTYYSFYEEREYHIADPLDMLTFILKRILLEKAKNDVSVTKEILSGFLEDKYLYFPKMALYIIGHYIEKYNDLFWEILDAKIVVLIVGETLYFGDELKHLLRNLKNLSDEQKKKLNRKIELNIEEAVKRHLSDNDSRMYIALRKQEIYQALSHDPYFKRLYNEMKKTTKVDAELHPAIGEAETRWGPEPGSSPLTKEKILQMTNKELAKFLLKFKTKDSWKGPTVDGIAELLPEIAKDRPEKFIEDLSPFKDTGFIYIYEILRGIKDAWNGKKTIDWTKLFQFIEHYINRIGFWEDKFIIEKDEWLGGANHEWIAGIVSELIQDGTRDDSWAFPEEYFDEAKKIIFLILDELKTKEDEEITDYVTYTLNTPYGKAITAFILFALRKARVNDKKDIQNDIKWSTEYMEKYDEILSKQIIEGYTCLGRYLPNFYYLDKEWVKEKIGSLEDEKGSKCWEAFMDGYLSSGKLYDDLYSLMKPQYQYGIEYDFKEKRDSKHLVHHISLNYLRGYESIDGTDGLFKQILDSFEYNQIEKIINFFWMQRSYLGVQIETNINIRERIIKFWKWLYEKYKGKESLEEDDKKVLSGTAKLAAILPKIDRDNFEWLMLSAPYVNINFSSPFFIEYLDKLKDKGDKLETAKYIGEIFLKMLEKLTPNYDEKHIRSIVEFLYELKDEETIDSANKMCNIYGSRGQEFLRDIYENKAK